MPINLPQGYDFADLQLERDDAGGLRYLPDPLAACCEANELDVVMTLGSNNMACMLVAEWYLSHRMSGGEPDPVAESILAEVAASEIRTLNRDRRQVR